jgi:hypothetical protein
LYRLVEILALLAAVAFRGIETRVRGLARMNANATNVELQPLPHKVLLIERDPRLLRQLTRTLKSIVADVHASPSLTDAAEAEQYPVILVNYDDIDDGERTMLIDRFGLRKPGGPRLLLFSGGKGKEDFAFLCGGHALTNLLARNNGVVDTEELIITMRKLLAGDIFGIEKYFAWGVECIRMDAKRASDRDGVLTAVEKYGAHLGINARLINGMCTVADEFVTNAIYNAPTDASGARIYTHKPRTEDVVLPNDQKIEIKVCSDGRRLGISTCDPFGSLDPAVILDYLAKCMRKGNDQVDAKEGGAGLGFYQVFESLSQFIVNIAPGRQTEMIGIIDASGSYKDFSQRQKSFNIFFAEPRQWQSP